MLSYRETHGVTIATRDESVVNSDAARNSATRSSYIPLFHRGRHTAPETANAVILIRSREQQHESSPLPCLRADESVSRWAEANEDHAAGGDACRKFAIGVGEIFFSPEIADGLLFFQTGRAHDAVTGAESLPLLNRPSALLPSSRSFTIKNVLSLVIETEADWPRGS